MINIIFWLFLFLCSQLRINIWEGGGNESHNYVESIKFSASRVIPLLLFWAISQQYFYQETAIYILSILGLLAACALGLAAVLIITHRQVVIRQIGSFKQQPNNAPLNNAENTFMAVLENAVGKNYVISRKIKVFELLEISSSSHLLEKVVTRIFREYYFDYVVLAKNDRHIACAVDLEEHSRDRHLKRLIKSQIYPYIKGIIETYCLRAGLPLLVIEQKRGYDLNELIERFEALAINSHPSQIDALSDCEACVSAENRGLLVESVRKPV